MKSIATVILNRNLPNETNSLYEHIEAFDGELTDIFVLEAGSEYEKLSKYCTWHVNTEEVMKNGLRYCRGMNYALLKLIEEDKFSKYEAFFLITNDTELKKSKSLSKLMEILNSHPKIGLLSPCSENWGELKLLSNEKTKYFWFIHNTAYLFRRELIEKISHQGNSNYLNFLFDGSNFRGYGCESEIIAKAYANDWAAAITNEVIANENESYLINYSERIRTEKYEENLKLYLNEGKKWMRNKYGFNSRWSMVQYVKYFYDKFFDYNPDLLPFKI